jgi:Tol biopolymer transport system component
LTGFQSERGTQIGDPVGLCQATWHMKSLRRRSMSSSAFGIGLLCGTLALAATGPSDAQTDSQREPTKLTRVRYSYPSLSPDGSQFVLEASVNGNWEIYTLDRQGMGDNGKGLAALTNNTYLDRMPSWSPDGRFIAFISDRAGNFDVFRMDADGRNVVQITRTPEPEIHPFWSPDSRTIVYNRRVDNERLYSIWTTDVEGAEHTEILRDEQLNSYAKISPDGQWIVFDKWWDNDETNGEIMLMDRNGGSLRRLTSNDVYDGYPAWFPDSQRVLFSSEVDGTFKLFSIEIDGTNQTQLSFGEGGDQRGVVDPDGRTIYFNRNLDDTIELYEMQLPGGSEG